MKSGNPEENHEPIRRLMREWKVTTPLPPRFTEGVWRRIGQTEQATKPSSFTALREWLDAILPRPAVAASYITVLLIAGISTGYWQARTQTARVDNELGTRYVQAVDPYQKSRL